MLTDVLTQGFYKINDPDVFKLIDIYDVDWEEKGTIDLQIVKESQEIRSALTETQSILQKKYRDPMWKTCRPNYVDLVNGLDDNVFEWHNDYEEQSVNLGILLYFSTTDEETGSAIKFRNANTKVQTGEFFPKKYDVCMINQGQDWQHVVTEQKIKVPRIVGSFHYWVQDIK